ncbi:MAG: DMT family transporter [Rhodospirillales bacterium]|nr:MAG: DMT family transporter [Rhodospirillales bacterium]
MASGNESTAPAGSTARAYALLIATALFWGANAIFGKLAIGEISPMALVALRWLGASLLLALIAHNQLRREWPLLRPRLPFLSAMGMLGFTAFNALFYVAAYHTTAVNIGIIQGAMPIFVLIGVYIAYRTRVTLLQVAGALATLTGVVIVGSGGDLARLAALAVNLGDAMMVAACVLYAGYTVGLRTRPQVSPLSLLAVLAGAAVLTSVPLVLIEAALGRFQFPTATGWAIAGAVTLLPSFLAQLFFIQGVTLIGPGRAGVFINLVPVFASVLAVVFLKEPFEAFHALALGLVLGGIWLSERGRAG